MPHTRQGGRCSSHTQGEIQGPLEPVGTLPLEVKSFRKPTKQKTPNLDGSMNSALSVCSAPVLVGKCFIVPWKFIMREGVGGERFVVASPALGGKVFSSLAPW